LAKACSRQGVPLTRASGTGNYGQSVPLAGGVVLDSARYKFRAMYTGCSAVPHKKTEALYVSLSIPHVSHVQYISVPPVSRWHDPRPIIHISRSEM